MFICSKGGCCLYVVKRVFICGEGERGCLYVVRGGGGVYMW